MWYLMVAGDLQTRMTWFVKDLTYVHELCILNNSPIGLTEFQGIYKFFHTRLIWSCLVVVQLYILTADRTLREATTSVFGMYVYIVHVHVHVYMYVNLNFWVFKKYTYNCIINLTRENVITIFAHIFFLNEGKTVACFVCFTKSCH